MKYDKPNEPLEFQKEFMDKLASMERQLKAGTLKLVSHDDLMKDIDDILADTRKRLDKRQRERLPFPSPLPR
ncbi:TPA: hypothetical protein ACKP97_003913 [Pseudomonas aeruginosa]|uniref:hypothetical protein n=1 Tax=Pseudomonas aeruginosa TaxID=287 RepID=UPI00071BC0DE|nr:hypothetical protein [Pseudomonas aeruginosa]AZZ10875.1 hypothetical protein CEK59_04155 [Pseudomonas aeruginosa]EKN9356147.1 hypothetical protein [Pseudomonas aeruginosa]MBG5166818.1 hypothetical protein [Pseudomonas aeruginosa]MBS9747729.1 hypothetical protein [Pseudomonas aeruginosa]MBX6656328.1 hypothetical protein [Pseudomonas aeruginosa]